MTPSLTPLPTSNSEQRFFSESFHLTVLGYLPYGQAVLQTPFYCFLCHFKYTFLKNVGLWLCDLLLESDFQTNHYLALLMASEPSHTHPGPCKHTTDVFGSLFPLGWCSGCPCLHTLQLQSELSAIVLHPQPTHTETPPWEVLGGPAFGR